MCLGRGEKERGCVFGRERDREREIKRLRVCLGERERGGGKSVCL